MVTCPHCLSVVTRAPDVVQRSAFRAALQRGRESHGGAGPSIDTPSGRYAVVAELVRGGDVDVCVARRVGGIQATVIVETARDEIVAAELAREARTLEALQAIEAPDALFFGPQLPRLVYAGGATRSGGEPVQVLIRRAEPGVWGSLADLLATRADGIDPRHVVWIWRRGLAVLGYVHRAGWTHGDVSPEHLLLQPDAHGIVMIGWRRARQDRDEPLRDGRSRDLRQLAWVIRSLLTGPSNDPPPVPARTPEPLADLLVRASEDASWLRSHDAAGIDHELKAAARAAFGPPRYVPFDPARPGAVGSDATN